MIEVFQCSTFRVEATQNKIPVKPVLHEFDRHALSGIGVASGCGVDHTHSTLSENRLDFVTV